MNFWNDVATQLEAMLPIAAGFSLLAPLPFIIAERLRPAGISPGWSSFAMNFAIATTTLVLAAPIGMAGVPARRQPFRRWC